MAVYVGSSLANRSLWLRKYRYLLAIPIVGAPGAVHVHIRSAEAQKSQAAKEH